MTLAEAIRIVPFMFNQENVMRTAAAIVFLTLFTSMLESPAQGQALNDKDVAKLVDEYVAEGTSETRRTDIQLKLLHVKPTLTTKNIKAAMGVDKKRAAALNLAVTLWTPGVFSAVKRYTDGELCPQIVKLALQRQEKEAVDYLFDRWKQAATDSTEFAAINEGFKTNYLDLPYVDKIKAVAEKETDESRKTAAGEVLAFQLSLAGASLQDVLDAWSAAREARAKDSKRFPTEGRDLLKLGKWKSDKMKNCGSNMVLTAAQNDGASHELNQDVKTMKPLHAGKWRINIRALVRGADCEFRCYIGVLVNKSITGPLFQLEGGKWTSPVSNNDSPLSSPVKPGTWVTLSFVIDDSVSAGKGRSAALFLDGQPLGENRAMPDQFDSMVIYVKVGEAVVCGVEAVPE